MLAHREEFMCVIFYEDGIEEGQTDGRKETRVVVDIEWDHIQKHWVSLSHVVELNGTPKPPNSSKIPEYYIIGNCFRQKVQQLQDNLANDETKRIAKEERKAALEAKKAKEAKKK